jgi:tRNA1(Val) A37 N6-methylase TrmN6
MLLEDEHLEPLSKDCSVIVSPRHTFNTDTILLAAFSMPRSGEVCADFGTGCGTIPLIWCTRSHPKHIYAIEIQPAACSMASRSAEYNHLEQMIEILPADIRNLKKDKILHNLDLIACNPPYKAAGSGIVNKDESLRIARHEEQCSLHDLAQAAAAALRFGGRFCLCQRPERLCDAMEELRKSGMEPKRLRFVQQRASKAPSLFLLEGKRGGKPGLVVSTPLLIEDEAGGFSEEMKQIYGVYGEGHA